VSSVRALIDVDSDSLRPNKVHDEARLYFSRMEKGDADALKLWREMREMSIVEYKKIYARLNVEFDIYGGESMQSEGMVKQLAILEEKKLLSMPPESKGAKLIDLEKFKLGKVVVVKQDGSTLYITRDIAAAVARWEKHHFDHQFYVVAKQQDLHFQQLFKTLELAGYDWSKRCTHVNFGMVKGTKEESLLL
jgi:arginyl-tRNA synthetase